MGGQKSNLRCRYSTSLFVNVRVLAPGILKNISFYHFKSYFIYFTIPFYNSLKSQFLFFTSHPNTIQFFIHFIFYLSLFLTISLSSLHSFFLTISSSLYTHNQNQSTTSTIKSCQQLNQNSSQKKKHPQRSKATNPLQSKAKKIQPQQPPPESITIIITTIKSHKPSNPPLICYPHHNLHCKPNAISTTNPSQTHSIFTYKWNKYPQQIPTTVRPTTTKHPQTQHILTTTTTTRLTSTLFVNFAPPRGLLKLDRRERWRVLGLERTTTARGDGERERDIKNLFFKNRNLL